MRMAELHMEAENVRAVMGGNNPPEPTVIERAQEAMIDLSNFLNETPVIENGTHLVAGKQFIERMRGASAELEAERTELVAPLNKQVAEINTQYKSIHNTDSKKPGILDKLLDELKSRLTAYATAEEAKRAREADLARIALAEKEAAARRAEEIERQAKQDAVVGCLDTGVAEAIAGADQAFSEFEHASRFAARAEKAVLFRIGNGVGKSLGMRTEKTLVLESYGRAIKAIGPHDKIRDGILAAARDYRKANGMLPDGVTETSERKF